MENKALKAGEGRTLAALMMGMDPEDIKGFIIVVAGKAEEASFGMHAHRVGFNSDYDPDEVALILTYVIECIREGLIGPG